MAISTDIESVPLARIDSGACLFLAVVARIWNAALHQ